MDILWRPNGGWGEFFLVVIGAFGFFIGTSLLYAFGPLALNGHTSGTFWYLTVFEIAVLILLGSLLHHRGWSARNLGLTPHWSDIPVGIVLAIMGWLAYYGAFFVLIRVAPHLAAAASTIHVVNNGISPAAALSVVVVNPFYEELFVCGYIVAALKQGARTGVAVNVSVAVRLLYHLYQGDVGVIGVVPMGLIFATFFAKTRRLWPLIVAHALLDAVGILGFVRW